MAEIKASVHVRYGVDFGPASKFIPPQMGVQEVADSGGGQPGEPNALSFVDMDGEINVFVMSAETKQKILALLTGGIIVAGGSDLIDGGGAVGGAG